jgi:DNA-directed RNA polymerase subunit RPC12/RpoP
MDRGPRKGAMTRGRVSSLDPGVGATLKRRPRNFEGAFPLLLVGSVLLVYCAILRNESLASHGVHFPLWGIVGAVGAVIAGAGVYSVFLEPSELAPPTVPDGFVMVSKAEWEAARAGPRSSVTPRSTTSVPPWWEGPSAYPDTAPAPPTSPTTPIETTQPYSFRAPKETARRSVATPPSPRPAGGGLGFPSTHRAPARTAPRPSPRPPPPPRRGSLDELEQTLAELEALVEKASEPSPRLTPGTRSGGSRRCADCNRRMLAGRASEPCSRCGRDLCVDCALSSQLEDADLKCNDCRAREARPRTAGGTGASRR